MNTEDSSREDLLLRPMTSEDESLMLTLEETIFADDPWTPGMIAEELRATGRYYVAAHSGEDVIGYAGITLAPDADIMTIGVLPQWRGQGVGTLLLVELLKAADNAGSKRVFLEVRASNEAAQALYHRHGFAAIGRIRNYFRHPQEDAVTMCRESSTGPLIH